MTSPMIEDYRWLTSPAAGAPLADAALGPLGSVALVARLRKTLSPERAALVAEQAALRRRATAKFPLAERMFFTARALEQATDALVAAHKAERFPPDARIVDFCCGIGGDLMAIAARGRALGIDRDPEMVALAEANLALAATPGALSSSAITGSRVSAANVSPDCVRAADFWHIDPDRRTRGARTSQAELGEPGPAMIESLLAANPQGAVKLAPAARAPADWATRAELEWISRGGECRQLVAWFARSPSRQASAEPR